ncbi:MAG: cyanobactin biosynthesis PatC/TenC/TruC family protein [Dehalococcoidia bacterium]
MPSEASGRLSPEAFAELVRNTPPGTGLSDYSFWYELLRQVETPDRLPPRRGRIWA